MRSFLVLLGLFLSSVTYAQTPIMHMRDTGPNPILGETERIKGILTIKRTDNVGWPDGKTPIAPEGFTVTKFAGGLRNPRWLYQLPNNDILVAESNTDTDKSANRITILRDRNQDSFAETRGVFLSGLNQPFGMTVIGDYFYVANTDGVWRYPYHRGQWRITGKGRKILALPAGGYNNHWTRNLLASPDGKKIYVSVGSGSNVGEHGMENETRRAAILEINPDGSDETLYSSGFRNPVGMAFEPVTKRLWTAVNERDQLGDDLVPDYITHVERGGFYGWPYSYFGQHEDPRHSGEQPELVAKAIKPDYALGSHTASLGLAFYDQKLFPIAYQNGAFIGQHGSWNRSDFSGYAVVFVPFQDGKPSGPPQDFLTGFLKDSNRGEAYGRPVGVLVQKNGSLLVADDAGNTVWHISTMKK